MIKFFLLAFLSLIIGCNKSCGNENQKDTLIIGTNANLPPFESVNALGKLEGFDIDLGNEIAKLLNKKVVFKEFDFDALILALQKGQIDIILSGMSITQSRQKEIFMVPYQGEAIKSIALVFWQHKPEMSNFEDLKNMVNTHSLPVSVQAGHFLESFLISQNINVKQLAGPPEQILDIKYKKSLAAALDPANAEELVKTHSELFLVNIDLPPTHWDLGNGIGIKKTNTKLQEDIQKAIENLRNNGTIKFLENTWLEGKN